MQESLDFAKALACFQGVIHLPGAGRLFIISRRIRRMTKEFSDKIGAHGISFFGPVAHAPSQELPP
jgi:hypothetical protein